VTPSPSRTQSCSGPSRAVSTRRNGTSTRSPRSLGPRTSTATSAATPTESPSPTTGSSRSTRRASASRPSTARPPPWARGSSSGASCSTCSRRASSRYDITGCSLRSRRRSSSRCVPRSPRPLEQPAVVRRRPPSTGAEATTCGTRRRLLRRPALDAAPLASSGRSSGSPFPPRCEKAPGHHRYGARRHERAIRPPRLPGRPRPRATSLPTLRPGHSDPRTRPRFRPASAPVHLGALPAACHLGLPTADTRAWKTHSAALVGPAAAQFNARFTQTLAAVQPRSSVPPSRSV